mgnify:CR=1 FL=1
MTIEKQVVQDVGSILQGQGGVATLEGGHQATTSSSLDEGATQQSHLTQCRGLSS